MEEMNGTPNPMPVNTNEPQMEVMVAELEAVIEKLRLENLSLSHELADTQTLSAARHDRAEMLANRTIEELVRAVSEEVVEEATGGRLWDACEIESMVEENNFVSEYDFVNHVDDALNYVDLSAYGAVSEDDVDDLINASDLMSGEATQHMIEEMTLGEDAIRQIAIDEANEHTSNGMVLELRDRVEALETVIDDLASALRGWHA